MTWFHSLVLVVDVVALVVENEAGCSRAAMRVSKSSTSPSAGQGDRAEHVGHDVRFGRLRSGALVELLDVGEVDSALGGRHARRRRACSSPCPRRCEAPAG